MHSDTHITARLAALEQACRTAGLPMTSQRRIIMETLASSVNHPTADDVYESVKGLLPGVSRTTVYRVLDLLVRLQVAIRINSPSARARYDADVHRHHHAICQVCEAVDDLRAPEFDGISLPEEDFSGFACNGYSVNFTGICRGCQKGEASAGLSHGSMLSQPTERRTKQ